MKRNKKIIRLALFSLLAITSCSNKDFGSTVSYLPTYNLIRDYKVYRDYDFSIATNFQDKSMIEMSKDKNKNFTFSPLSYFDALSLLSVFTDYNDHHIYNDLGYDNIEDLIQQIKNYRLTLNFDDKESKQYETLTEYKSRLASAVSFKKDYPVNLNDENKELLDSLQMAVLEHGSTAGESQQIKWLKESTFNLFSPKKSIVNGSSDMAIISTLAYIANPTSGKFNTTNLSFNNKLVSGIDITTTMNYYRNDEILMVSLPIRNEKLTFYMPYNLNNFSLEKALENRNEMSIYRVHLNAPFFKVSNSHELRTYTSLNMNMPYLFDEWASNKLLSTGASKVSNIRQDVTFEFSKKGVSGVAVTVVDAVGSAAPGMNNFVEVIIDRPFYFTFTDASNTILFSGFIKNI